MPDIKKPKIQEEQKMKVSLKELPKKYKKSGDKKEEVKPSPIAPPMPKGSQLKEIAKEPIKYKPNKPVKKATLNKPKSTKPKPVTKPKPKVNPLPQKPFIELASNKDNNTTVKKEPKEIIKKKEPVNPLYAILSQDKSSEEETEEVTKTYSQSNINNNIKELYGEEFGKLSAGQQKYIIDNQEIMRRITQQVLTRVARVNLPRDLNVNETNIIEFYLHPNGDMTDFKFLKKSGYYVLDDTTKETIGYAYSRYPRPTEKTLVRYNVFYNLAR
jgi:outer membrane biosynthesis protein TonB